MSVLFYFTCLCYVNRIIFTNCKIITNEFDTIFFCFIGISLLSLRILSFHSNRSLLFINKCIVLHIIFPERNADIRVLSCFTLPLPAQTVDRIIDTQLCRGILFVLSSLGWICILVGKGVYRSGRRIPIKMGLVGFQVQGLDCRQNCQLFSNAFREKDVHELKILVTLLYIPFKCFSDYKYTLVLQS